MNEDRSKLEKKEKNMEKASRLAIWGSFVSIIIFIVYLILIPEPGFKLRFFRGLLVFGGVTCMLIIPYIVTLISYSYSVDMKDAEENSE